MKLPQEFRTIQRFLSVISDPCRLKILFFLKDGEHCVCEIQKALKVPQNLASYHLKVLRDMNLITATRDGVNMHYHLERKTLQKNRKMFHEIFGTGFGREE